MSSVTLENMECAIETSPVVDQSNAVYERMDKVYLLSAGLSAITVLTAALSVQTGFNKVLVAEENFPLLLVPLAATITSYATMAFSSQKNTFLKQGSHALCGIAWGAVISSNMNDVSIPLVAGLGAVTTIAVHRGASLKFGESFKKYELIYLIGTSLLGGLSYLGGMTQTATILSSFFVITFPLAEARCSATTEPEFDPIREVARKELLANILINFSCTKEESERRNGYFRDIFNRFFSLS